MAWAALGAWVADLAAASSVEVVAGTQVAERKAYSAVAAWAYQVVGVLQSMPGAAVVAAGAGAGAVAVAAVVEEEVAVVGSGYAVAVVG